MCYSLYLYLIYPLEMTAWIFKMNFIDSMMSKLYEYVQYEVHFSDFSVVWLLLHMCWMWLGRGRQWKVVFLRTSCSIWLIYDWYSKKWCYSGEYTKAQDTKCEIISSIFLTICNQNILSLVACLFLECGQAHYWLHPDNRGSAVIAAAYPVLSLSHISEPLWITNII